MPVDVCILVFFVLLLNIISNAIFLVCLSKDSRLNDTSLTGLIPMPLSNITTLQMLWANLPQHVVYFYYTIFLCKANVLFWIFTFKCRDLSNNQLSGVVPDSGSFSLFTPIRFFAQIWDILACSGSDLQTISEWTALLAVLTTTWTYVAQSLGILVPGLLHFLLLPLLSHHPQSQLQVTWAIFHHTYFCTFYWLKYNYSS